jgi:hypothetical protein
MMNQCVITRETHALPKRFAATTISQNVVTIPLISFIMSKAIAGNIGIYVVIQTTQSSLVKNAAMTTGQFGTVIMDGSTNVHVVTTRSHVAVQLV